MLLGDAHIEETLREAGREAREPGPGRHPGSDCADPIVLGGEAHQLFGERGGVALWPAAALGLRWHWLLGRVDQAQVDRRQARTMEADAVELGGGIALSLHGLDMDQHRSPQCEGALEDLLHLGHVVPVEDADVGDPHVLEEAHLGPRALEALLGEGEHVEEQPPDDRDPRQHPLGGRLGALVGGRQTQLVQLRREAADRTADAHLVVVEHDQEPMLRVAEMVQRLHRQPALQRSVAHADRDALASGLIRRFTPVEDVVIALRATGETAHPVELAKGVEPLEAAGEQLVSIGLMAGVPHDPVTWRVEHAMESERDLDGAQGAGQVPAGDPHGADHLLAQLGGERAELSGRHPPQLRWVGQRRKDLAGFGALHRRESIGQGWEEVSRGTLSGNRRSWPPRTPRERRTRGRALV